MAVQATTRQQCTVCHEAIEVGEDIAPTPGRTWRHWPACPSEVPDGALW
jgi:hypothetical protein